MRPSHLLTLQAITGLLGTFQEKLALRAEIARWNLLGERGFRGIDARAPAHPVKGQAQAASPLAAQNLEFLEL